MPPSISRVRRPISGASNNHFPLRIGLEAGPLSQWLYGALAETGLPVICVETRHMRAVLKAQINKTDRNDARGMAQMMRVGLYRPVHVKTLRSQKLRMLLTHRKLVRGTLADVSTVQRLDTHGGVLQGACDHAGDFASVPYSATYVFLRKGG
jgi:transposase